MNCLDISKKYIGLQEVRDNKQLKSLLKSQAIHSDIAIDPAKISWCAAWVNFCEREVGNPGTGKLNAQSFNTYGHEVKEEDAEPGDIVVFHFPFDADWQGHVAIFESWDDNDNKIKVCGGNQSNRVCEQEYIQDYVTHIRRYK